MASISFVEAKTREIFDASIFKVEMRKPSVSRPHVQEFAINGKDKSYCLRLWFDLEEGTLDVVSLEKCNAGDAGKGNALLHRVNKLASSIPEIHSIKLDDASEITLCDVIIHFSILRILTTGMSWYNYHGYFSENHKANFEHNQSIITQPFNQMLLDAFHKNLEIFRENNTREKITEIMRQYELLHTTSAHCAKQFKEHQAILTDYDNHMQTGLRNVQLQFLEILNNDVFTDVPPTDTVRAYVTGVLHSIGGHSLTCVPVQRKRAELLKKIVDFMKSLIIYNDDLTKPVMHRAGGKRRRMQTRRNHKKCNKKSKRNQSP
jgi:hypothetical protein